MKYRIVIRRYLITYKKSFYINYINSTLNVCVEKPELFPELFLVPVFGSGFFLVKKILES